MGNPVGRPTDYEEKYCAEVIELGRQGKSITQISALLNVSKQTIYNWEKQFPDFLDATTRARELAQAWWEDQGQENLTSPVFQSSLWSKQVSCRFPDDYRENKQQLEHTGKDGQPIETKNVTSLDMSGLTTEQLRVLASIMIKSEE